MFLFVKVSKTSLPDKLLFVFVAYFLDKIYRDPSPITLITIDYAPIS